MRINPSAPSCRTPCSNPHTAIEAVSMPKRLPSTSGSSTQRVITAREKWPWPTNTTSRDSMCSNANATARSARSLTCATLSPPGHPCVQTSQSGSDSRNLRGGQALVGAVIPLGEQWGHLVDGEAGQLGRVHGTLSRAADHQRVIEFQFAQRAGPAAGLGPAVVGQLEIGATGVLARLGPLGLAVAQQHQSVVVEAHADRFCRRLRAIRARAPRGWCQDGACTPRCRAKR